MPYKNQDYGINPTTYKTLNVESMNVESIAGGNTGVTTTLFYNGLTGALTLGDSAASITGELDTTGGLVKTAKLELTNHIKLNTNAGTSGQLLTSGGENAVPTWTTLSTPTSIYLSGTLPVDSAKLPNGYHVLGGANTGGFTFDIDSGNITKNAGLFTVPEACKLQISFTVTARDNTAPKLIYELLIDIEKALAASPTTFVKKKSQITYLQSMGGTLQFSCNCSGMIDFAQGDIFRGNAYIASAGGTGTPDAIFKNTGTHMSVFRIN